eukprot:jgi/Ulvmu1/12647/UM094_0003.1
MLDSDHERFCLILPHGAARSRAYVAFPVDDALAARSSVMATLVETEGIANLPEGLPTADFLKWCETKPDEASTLPAEDICVALRIADEMCDADTDKLASALASKLTSTSWGKEDESKAMQRLLLSLDCNLQHLVLRQVTASTSAVLSSWPSHLRQAYVNMLVAYEGKDLQIKAEHPPDAVDSLLGLLSTTSPIAPGLQSLQIHPPIATDTTATAAGHALRHHASSLVSLTMTPPAADDAAPAAVLHALPHLTLLTNLHLTFADPCPRYGTAAADAVHLLTAAVPALPALARFYLFDLRTATYMQLPKHAAQRPSGHTPQPSEAASASKPTLDPLADVLCAAPALTRLALGHARPDNAVPLPCRVLRGPLPALRELQLTSFRPYIGTAPDGAIPDRQMSLPPLAALTAFLYDASRETMTLGDVTGITACVAQHAQLQRLELLFWHLPDGALPAVADMLLGLPPLESLVLMLGPTHGQSTRDVHSAAAAVARHTGLTKLEFAVESLKEPVDAAAEDGAPPVAVTDMLTPLSVLTALRELRIGNNPPSWQQPSVNMQDALLAGPLGSFPQLTSLVADCGSHPVFVPLIAPAWAQLPRLRRLYFHSLLCMDGDHLVACMAPLTALTELRLAAVPVDEELVRAFGAAAAAMPALRHAQLSSSAKFVDVAAGAEVGELAERDWIHGLLQLPRRGRFEFGRLRNPSIPEREYEEVRNKLVASGADVGPRCSYVSFLPPGEGLEWSL